MHLCRVGKIGFITVSFQFRCQLIFLLLLFFGSSLAKASEQPQELIILTWTEYISPEMIAAFEDEHDAKVKYVYFESDNDRDQILLQTEGKGFDLIIANGFAINSYRKRNWLQPMPVEKIPNMKYIENRWQSSFESAQGYGVPYFWGTLGIAYRKDLVSEPITSWTQLFRPSKELQGKILMVESSKDVIGMALKSLGYSANSEDNSELLQAEELLLSSKSHVSKFTYLNLDETSSLVTGEIVAAMAYGGDALNIAQHNENIVYVLPEEGGSIWMDYFTLSTHADHPELAVAFIDFINQPEWAARNAEELYLATSNSEAKKILSPDILNNPVIYPDSGILARSEFYKELTPRSNRKRASIFAHIIK